MVFKRRTPRSWLSWAREMVYPTGGFRRAIRYVIHRMRRLPDDPRRVARGVFAGFLIGFLPLPGLQFLAAWGLAVVMRGNVLAALLATFNSNPVTTPIFAVFAMSFGHWLLGVETPLSGEAIGRGFGHAGRDIWNNVTALFMPHQAQWEGLIQFWNDIYLPYFIGALLPGLVLSLGAYWITIPLVRAYQHARAAKSKERNEKRRRLRQTLAEAAARLKHRGEARADEPRGDDDGPGAP